MFEDISTLSLSDKIKEDHPIANNVTKKIAYIHSDEYLRIINGLPRIYGRASLVHNLIKAYGLLDVVEMYHPHPATEQDLKTFHSEDYIELLKKIDTSDSDAWDEAEEYGLGYDCPIIPHLYKTVSWIAGGTITAAQVLTSGSCQFAVNWGGGWHHAKKDEAAGFCYVSDVVLGILHLRQKFSKVLYVDLDLHHGDGVEDAFAYTSRVLCVSFHKYGDGFYPGTGSLEDIGYGKGQYYTVNIPLHDGTGDEQFVKIALRILKAVFECFNPDAVVCQCGADTLNGDPMASFNLTPHGIGSCIKVLASWHIPLLLLGGGGYHLPNTARCWTYLLSLLAEKDLTPDIPEHPYFLAYGPDYDLTISQGNRADGNSNDYISAMSETILGNLQHIR